MLGGFAGRGAIGGTGHRFRRCGFHLRGGWWRWGRWCGWWRSGGPDHAGRSGSRLRRGRRGQDRLRRGLRYRFRRRWRRRGGLRGRRGLGWRRRGSRLRRWRGLGWRFRRAGRRGWRRWAVRVAVMAPAVAAPAAFPVVGALVVTVMSATRAASFVAAAGHRGHHGAGRAVAGVGRRVGAAISHGRRDGQGRPQQDRDCQQAPGTGSVHPGSMGPRAPGHARLSPGSPERVDWGPERFEPVLGRSCGRYDHSADNSHKGLVGIGHSLTRRGGAFGV